MDEIPASLALDFFINNKGRLNEEYIMRMSRQIGLNIAAPFGIFHDIFQQLRLLSLGIYTMNHTKETRRRTEGLAVQALTSDKYFNTFSILLSEEVGRLFSENWLLIISLARVI